MARLAEVQMHAEASFDTPADAASLDFLQAVYRNAGLPLSTRMRAAIAALPFEHPKLAVTAQIDIDGDFAERLEQAILRSGLATKVIDHEPASPEPLLQR